MPLQREVALISISQEFGISLDELIKEDSAVKKKITGEKTWLEYS